MQLHKNHNFRVVRIHKYSLKFCNLSPNKKQVLSFDIHSARKMQIMFSCSHPEIKREFKSHGFCSAHIICIVLSTRFGHGIGRVHSIQLERRLRTNYN